MNEPSQIQQIRQRRAAVQDIEITDDTPERGQHYGYVLGVGNNHLGTLWHCSDDRTHPDHAAVVAAGGDVADLYCNSHYASVADEAVFEFFLKAKEDVQTLLDELGRASAQTFQARTYAWILACFGPEEAADTVERHHRFLEEALELVQATGCTEAEAQQLVAYVYGRPVGEAHQEVGGVMLTLAALCTSHGLEMQVEGETELARAWTKTEQIRAKQAAKPKHSPLPGFSTPAPIRPATFEHRVEFRPGFDDVPGGRGIDGGEFYFTVIGPSGAVAFQLLNNWYPATITTDLSALHKMMPMGGVVSWHARTPWDAEPPERLDCPYLNGPCFVRTSYSEGDALKQTLLEHGSKGLWQTLEALYVEQWPVESGVSQVPR